MKRWVQFFLTLLVIVSIVSIRPKQNGLILPASSESISNKEHSLLVKVSDSFSQTDLEDELKSTSSQFEIDQIDAQTYSISLSSERSMEEVKSRLNENGKIDYAENNGSIKIHLSPDDPYFTTNEADTTNQWSLAKIDAPAAWDTTVGDNVVVAVIDTGIDWDHPDLVRNVWVNQAELTGIADNLYDFSSITDINANNQIDCDDLFDPVNTASSLDSLDTDNNGYVDDVCGWDFVNNENNPADGHRHGTHVAGTIGAHTSNTVGVAGVNWEVRVMGLRVLDNAGNGTYSDAIEALEYARQNGAQVVNMSWGGTDPSQALQDKINELHTDNIVQIVSAGNNNRDATVEYPARSDNVMTVGNTTSTDARQSSSNFGPKLELAAPGTTILSIKSSSGSGCGPSFSDSDYIYCTGTSMSAPHVAGAAALLLSDNTSLTNNQVYQVLQENTETISPSQYLGYGRLNLNNSIDNSIVNAANTSAFTSILSTTDNSVEAGTSLSVTVTIRNGYGAVLSGKTISLSSSRPTFDSITPSSQITNGSGQATFSIDTTTSGTFYVYATDTTPARDLIIADQLDLEFTATLDHFEISAVSQKNTQVPFQISVTAKSATDFTIGTYSSTTTLADSTATISPSSISAFVNGTWTGNVTVNNYRINNFITASFNGNNGSSNAFNVVHPNVSITSVSPGSVKNSGSATTQTITINGTNFRTGLSIAFAKSGNANITCTSVNVTSSTRATCTGNFDARSTREWSARGINTGINTNLYTKANALIVYRGSDFDTNLTVDVFDFSTLLGQWNQDGSADINGDDAVNLFDFSILLSEWGSY